jgi:hypothetical protein
MKYVSTLLLCWGMALPTIAQWSDLTNSFYDSLHMPVAVAPLNQGNSIVIRSYPDSGYIVIWEDNRSNFSDADIYAQKFDKLGNALWTLNGVPVATGPDYQQIAPSSNTDYRYYPHACTDSSGGFYVTWQDNNQTNTGVTNKARVCVQHIRQDGSMVFPSIGYVIAEGTPTDVYQFGAPQLIADGNNGFFIGYIRSGFGTADVIVQCYRDENGTMKLYGGGMMDPNVTQGTAIGPCGIRQYFQYLDDYVYNFYIYPDLQKGCGIVFTFGRNNAQPLRGPFVAWNKLCRVKKDARVTVQKRTSDIAATSTIERFYKKDSVVALYNLRTYFFSQICLPNVVPNEVIENGGEGYLLLDDYTDARPVQDLYYPKGVMVPTGGNVHANVLAVIKRYYLNNALTPFYVHLYSPGGDEIYDSIPYQLASDDTHPYWAYNLTKPAGLQKTTFIYDTLMASGTYYFDFALTGGGNRIFSTAKVLHPAYSNGGTILLQELHVEPYSADSFAIKRYTPDKSGLIVGRELNTGFQNANINYDNPNIAMDQTGNAVFYITEYQRYVRASPIANNGQLIWGAMGRPLGKTSDPGNPCIFLGGDGTAVASWHDYRPTPPNQYGANVFMRHLDSLHVYTYIPPVKKLLNLNIWQTFVYPYILNGTSKAWSVFEASTNAGWTPVTSILDDYPLGNVQTQVYKHNTAIRTINGKPYLDRNYTIWVENNLTGGATLPVRLYFTQSEFDALKAADPTILTPGNLGILKQPNATATVPAVYAPAAGETLINPDSWGAVDGGYYLQFTVNSFSNFFIMKGSDALPVTWLGIQAQWLNSAQAKVSWQVADQQQVKDYVVQRSTDGISYTDVCTVEANANTQYNCVLTAAANTKHYYRIWQRDLDGRSAYSRIVTLQAFDRQKRFVLIPNPASDYAVLSTGRTDVKIRSLRLYNSNGVEVWAQNRKTNMGDVVQIPVYQLAAGVYSLRIDDGRQVETMKLIKK